MSELLVSGVAANLENQESQSLAEQGHARRHALPVGMAHASIFQQSHPLFHANWMLSGKDGSGKLGKAGSVDEIEGTNVLDGTIVTSSDSKGLSCDSRSSSEAKVAAVIVEDDRSSCNVASTVRDGGEKVMEFQFFVNCGKGSMVVPYDPGLMVPQIIELGSEDYVVPGL